MDAIEQMYQQVILDHAQERHGAGALGRDLDATSHQVNPTCGDEVTLGVRLDADRLAHLVWDGQGCSISQASLSMMSDLVEGKTLDQIEALRRDFDQMMHSRGKDVPDDVLDPLEDAAALQGTSQFPNRVKCALLGWMALRDALAQAEADGARSGESRLDEDVLAPQRPEAATGTAKPAVADPVGLAVNAQHQEER